MLTLLCTGCCRCLRSRRRQHRPPRPISEDRSEIRPNLVSSDVDDDPVASALVRALGSWADFDFESSGCSARPRAAEHLRWAAQSDFRKRARTALPLRDGCAAMRCAQYAELLRACQIHPAKNKSAAPRAEGAAWRHKRVHHTAGCSATAPRGVDYPTSRGMPAGEVWLSWKFPCAA